MITDINQLDFNKKYSYADYLTWQFDEMVELIFGKVYRISPAPNRFHQQVFSNLHGLIWSFLRKNPCQAFSHLLMFGCLYQKISNRMIKLIR